MAWPAVKRAFTQEEFRAYVAGLSWPRWRPSLIVWHNTAAPTLAQWHASAVEDERKGIIPPGLTRIRNLERYYQNDQKWSGGPHLFIDDEFIWVFNPLTSPGVHSPSWNRTSLGFEMIGDFDREDDDSGLGLKVKQNAIFATAVICDTLGLSPEKAIRLHKEDPRTTHACPGVHIAQDKEAMIAAVESLMAAGEHSHSATAEALGVAPTPPQFNSWWGQVTASTLNVRTGPGVSNRALGALPKGASVHVVGNAAGGPYDWLRIDKTHGLEGWVSERYVKYVKQPPQGEISK